MHGFTGFFMLVPIIHTFKLSNLGEISTYVKVYCSICYVNLMNKSVVEQNINCFSVTNSNFVESS